MFDPLGSNHQTLYAGTGSFSSLDALRTPLSGLLKTTDGGKTWTELGSDTFRSDNVHTILPTKREVPGRGQVIFVAGYRGLYRTLDGGRNWHSLGTDNVTEENVLPRKYTSDVIVDPQDPQTIFAAIPGEGIYRSTTGGSSWVDISTNFHGPDYRTGIGVCRRGWLDRVVGVGCRRHDGRLFRPVLHDDLCIDRCGGHKRQQGRRDGRLLVERLAVKVDEVARSAGAG